MNNEQLRSILSEYRPSMRLVVTVDRKALLETTVCEIMLKLTMPPPSDWVNFYGRDSCVIRERNGVFDHGGPPFREWLEIDLR